MKRNCQKYIQNCRGKNQKVRGRTSIQLYISTTANDKGTVYPRITFICNEYLVSIPYFYDEYIFYSFKQSVGKQLCHSAEATNVWYTKIVKAYATWFNRRESSLSSDRGKAVTRGKGCSTWSPSKGRKNTITLKDIKRKIKGLATSLIETVTPGH